MQTYEEFLDQKTQLGEGGGFEPIWFPTEMFDFQKALTGFSIRKGRSAQFADCGLGKTVMQETWAENVTRHTNGRVLILTPLAVAAQSVEEGNKFGIDVQRSKMGKLPKSKIVVTNYEQLRHYDANDFVGCVCDESSILKNFDGVRKQEVTDFMRKMPYRLLCTATAAPNDYIELGTSSEALGQLGHMDMLNRFFKNDMNNSATGRAHGKVIQWRFKGHAEEAFWRFVVSWARAVRKPSDLGFDDGRFVLPQLLEIEHVIEAKLRPGFLFPMAAVGMAEQREESKVTITERCEKVAYLTEQHDSSLVWCHLNQEGDLLEKLIPDCVQVSGREDDDAKEEKFLAFASGQAKRLITKYKIGAWGLNFQHNAHQTHFPSNSFEQYYQGVRRSWRFGQKRKVTIDIVRTEGQAAVMENQKRKAAQAAEMFEQLVERMNQELHINRSVGYPVEEGLPLWL